MASKKKVSLVKQKPEGKMVERVPSDRELLTTVELIKRVDGDLCELSGRFYQAGAEHQETLVNKFNDSLEELKGTVSWFVEGEFNNELF